MTTKEMFIYGYWMILRFNNYPDQDKRDGALWRSNILIHGFIAIIYIPLTIFIIDLFFEQQNNYIYLLVVIGIATILGTTIDSVLKQFDNYEKKFYALSDAQIKKYDSIAIAFIVSLFGLFFGAMYIIKTFAIHRL